MPVSFLSTVLLGQYEAALGTLRDVIEQCPEQVWSGKAGNHPFSESAFHALFFADVYLGESVEAVKDQEFHRAHAEQFEGYEELESRLPVRTYSPEFVLEYLRFCRAKATQVLHASSQESLEGNTGIEWHDFSRAEMHVYNIRHLQHHAAQLIMRLRLDSDIDIGWYRTGFDGPIRSEG